MPDGQFYEVCNHGWVIAGMYAKTFTRLATMELAAESARHAVNAIIHHRAGQPEGQLRGDFCRIFNPEDEEIDDLATLKRIDARLYQDNLPHFMDILGWEQAIEALTRSANPIADLGKLVTSSVNTFRRDWNMQEMTPEEMRGRALDLLDRMVKAARQLLGDSRG